VARKILFTIVAVLFLSSSVALSAEAPKKNGAAKPAQKAESRTASARFYASLNPAEGSLINNPRPNISAEYVDEGIGVSTQDSRMFIDGADITPQAQFSANKIVYVPATPLADGTHKVKLDVVDRAGNAATASWTFVIHTKAPVIKITSHKQNQFVNQSPITVSGTLDNPKSRVVVNGISAYAERGTFSAKVNLVEGNNTITAVATDVFGNSGTDSVVVIVDTTPPVVEITAPTATSLVNTRLVTVSGIADKNTASVTVGAGKGQGVPAVVNAGTFTAKDVPLEEGQNTIVAKAVSLAGNTGTALVKVNVDSIPPRIAISLPKEQTITNKKMITVSGAVDDPTAMVKVNNTPVQIERGVFTLASLNLVEGSNTITATAVDRAGNQAKASVITVVLDTTPPASPTLDPLPPVTRSTQITVSGKSEPGAQVDLFVNSGMKGKAKADDKGIFSIKISISEGNNAMTAVAYDAIGNASPSSAVVNVFLDTKPPKIL